MAAYNKILDAMHVLKHLPRKGWIEHGLLANRVEPVGSHAFGTALLALVLAEAKVLPAGMPLDRLLVVALLHDITESVTGDMTPTDNVPAARKAELERDAVKQLLDGVPGMAGLQRELETFVAAGDAMSADPVHAIVKQIDKLDMMIQALRYEKETGKDLSDFYDNPRKYLQDPRLLAFFEDARKAIRG